MEQAKLRVRYHTKACLRSIWVVEAISNHLMERRRAFNEDGYVLTRLYKDDLTSPLRYDSLLHHFAHIHIFLLLTWPSKCWHACRYHSPPSWRQPRRINLRCNGTSSTTALFSRSSLERSLIKFISLLLTLEIIWHKVDEVVMHLKLSEL